MNALSCNTASLNPFQASNENPWNRQKAQHLFRRIGFGANYELIQSVLAENPIDVIDNILVNAENLPITTPPSWAENNVFSYLENGAFNFDLYIAHAKELQVTWVSEMFDMNKVVREKMVLFWSNHFVTVFDDYENTTALYQYHKLLQEKALGNFKDFVYEIGLNPAMLLFLNGATNVAEDTNENYARELFELFTLGENIGYTQTDIEEASRALTGYTTENGKDIIFNAEDFDNGVKTIFGETGNWNYEDLINILFEQRAEEIAVFICKKLYKFYVSHEISEEIINELALTFRNNNWEIAPVLHQLFKSEHFFDATIIGNKIKSPTELLLTFINELGYEPEGGFDSEQIADVIAYMGQRLLSPPDVAGWQENRNWIDNNALTLRWEITAFIGYIVFEDDVEFYRNFAKTISDSENDPTLISQQITDYFLANGFHSVEDYNIANTVFKGEVPENYFNNGYWNLEFEYAPQQVALLFFHLIKQPEFQLC